MFNIHILYREIYSALDKMKLIICDNQSKFTRHAEQNMTCDGGKKIVETVPKITQMLESENKENKVTITAFHMLKC